MLKKECCFIMSIPSDGAYGCAGALGGCASQPANQLMLMPAPDVFDQGDWRPIKAICGAFLPLCSYFSLDSMAKIILEWTRLRTEIPSRMTSPTAVCSMPPYRPYANRPGEKGTASIIWMIAGMCCALGWPKFKDIPYAVGKEGMTWEEARRISLLKERPEDYPLKLTGVQEIGILGRSINAFTEELVDRDQGLVSDEPFAAKINAKLAMSKVKDVFIYVHGYKVVFENPLLVASELWHFLGYEGVFIAFAWPSTPSTLAYFSDLETAALSAGNLRLLIQYLAEETHARRIHIIGYSAGTRVVAQALDQLALMNAGPNGKEFSEGSAHRSRHPHRQRHRPASFWHLPGGRHSRRRRRRNRLCVRKRQCPGVCPGGCSGANGSGRSWALTCLKRRITI